MQQTPLVPDASQSPNDQRVDVTDAPTESPDSAPAPEPDGNNEIDSGAPIEQRFTRHRAGDTVVLYDRLEQTTWVQADYDPADLV